jgi:hypothetical protein
MICHSEPPPCIRQHTSAYVSIRQHTSAYVSIREHTCTCSRSTLSSFRSSDESTKVHPPPRTCAYVSIRQHTSAYVQHTSAYVSIQGAPAGTHHLLRQRMRQHMSYVQHTSAFVSIRQHTRTSSSEKSVMDHFSGIFSGVTAHMP